MAYKDEYEVARLMLDDDGLDEALHVAGDTGSISYKLHPPMLRALGLEHKIDIPLSAKPAIELLAKSKRLRGTMLDPFRWAEVRRVERKLVGEYRTAIDAALASLDVATLGRAVDIAELPDIVRGYEDIKLANVARFRAELKRLTP
jgi:indolepyruvate ferredoxin oxidoreductase